MLLSFYWDELTLYSRQVLRQIRDQADMGMTLLPFPEGWCTAATTILREASASSQVPPILNRFGPLPNKSSYK